MLITSNETTSSLGEPMPLFGTYHKMQEQKRLRVERSKAGRFFKVTCEKRHTAQMSAIDLARRLDDVGEKIVCPECYEKVRIGVITDGPLMSEEQKKQQQADYLEWSEEQAKERRRRREALDLEMAASDWP
jgi:hypothetical protein